MALFLPIEITTKIFRFCSQSDFPALCRTNKTSRDIAEPLLYRDIRISFRDVQTQAQIDKAYRRAVRLYETLRNDPTKATMVNRLEVAELTDHEPSSGCAAIEFTPVCYMPPSEFTGEEETRVGLTKLPTAIAAVLSLLSDLTIFHCSGHQEKRSSITLLTLLEHVAAPSLHEFKLDITEDILNVRIDHQWAGRYNVYNPRAPLPYFLQRHLHLKHVVLRIEDTMPDSYLENFALSMPKLEQFEAPEIYFRSLTKNTPLKHASINLINVNLSQPFHIRLDRVLAGLQSSVNLKSLTLRMENFDYETIKVISRRLPDLDKLEIRHELYMYRLPISTNGIWDMAKALSEFTGLRHITFLWVLRNSIGTVDDRNQDVDQETVSSWGEACSTLAYCSIYGSVWKRTGYGDAWTCSSRSQSD